MAGDVAAATSYVDVDPAALRDAEALRALLGAHAVDTAGWGAGASKRVEDLLEEIRQRETRLVLLPPAPGAGAPPALLRLLRTLNVFVSAAGAADGRVLCEECQTLPDGRQRRRGLPLSEKMIAGESWREALRRAVTEELGTALPDAGAPQARSRVCSLVPISAFAHRRAAPSCAASLRPPQSLSQDAAASLPASHSPLFSPADHHR